MNPIYKSISAFSTTKDPNCPVDNDWNVQNKNSWKMVPDFLTCRANNEDERQAYKLARTVCQLLKRHQEDSGLNNIERRVNNLCQRATNLAKVGTYYDLDWSKFVKKVESVIFPFFSKNATLVDDHQIK